MYSCWQIIPSGFLKGAGTKEEEGFFSERRNTEGKMKEQGMLGWTGKEKPPWWCASMYPKEMLESPFPRDFRQQQNLSTRICIAENNIVLAGKWAGWSNYFPSSTRLRIIQICVDAFFFFSFLLISKILWTGNYLFLKDNDFWPISPKAHQIITFHVTYSAFQIC